MNELLRENQLVLALNLLRGLGVIKSQLALNVAGQFFHLPRHVVEKAVDVVLDEIVTAMARKDRVELRGLRHRELFRRPRGCANIQQAPNHRSSGSASRRDALYVVKAQVPAWEFRSG
jgi:nucleoid DNA-binding protein